jgi:hypothetical protein
MERCSLAGGSGNLLRNGRNPDRCKAHVLDVIELNQLV